jgi:hypothetical protein
VSTETNFNEGLTSLQCVPFSRIVPKFDHFDRLKDRSELCAQESLSFAWTAQLGTLECFAETFTTTM